MVTHYRVSLEDTNVKTRRLQGWNHLAQDGKKKHEPDERSVQKLSIVWLHTLGLCADKKYTSKYIAVRFDSGREGRK